MADSFWDKYDEAVSEESTGGGIVAQVLIETGYKAYVGGLDQADTFFPAPTDNKKKRDAAKAKCNALGSKANWGIQIRIYLEGAVTQGKPATWQDDRFRNTDGWTSACQEVVVPSLKAAGISKLPFKGYARIGFKPDPFKVALGEEGKTQTDLAGNPRFPRVAYVVETLTKKEYQVAIAGAPAPAQESLPYDGPAVPSAWEASPDGWKRQVTKLKADITSPEAPLPILREEVEALALAMVEPYAKEGEEPTLARFGGTVEDVLAWLPLVD